MDQIMMRDVISDVKFGLILAKKSKWVQKIEDSYNNIMLVVSSPIHTVTLREPLTTVLHIFPCFNNTFVLLGLQRSTTFIQHISQDNRVIKQIKKQNNISIQEISLLNDRQILYLDPDNNQIVSWNVQTNTFVKITHIFKEQTVRDMCILFMFPQSSSFCIIQTGNYKNNYLKISYYHYPLNIQKQIKQPFLTLEQQDIWSSRDIINKGNHHSMVIWFDSQSDLDTVIRTYDFKEDIQGTYKEYLFKQIMIQEIPLYNLELSISYIWESKKNILFLSCITNEKYQNEPLPLLPSTLYILNTETLVLRRTTIQQIKYPFAHQISHIINILNISAIICYDYQKGVPKMSPIYYIDNFRQKLIHTEYWIPSHLKKWQILGGMSMKGYLQLQYENGNVSQIQVKQIQVVGKDILYSFFMDQWEGVDWDCDLIKAVVLLLDHSE